MAVAKPWRPAAQPGALRGWRRSASSRMGRLREASLRRGTTPRKVDCNRPECLQGFDGFSPRNCARGRDGEEHWVRMEAFRKQNLTVWIESYTCHLEVENRVVLLCVPSKYQWWEHR